MSLKKEEYIERKGVIEFPQKADGCDNIPGLRHCLEQQRDPEKNKKCMESCDHFIVKVQMDMK